MVWWIKVYMMLVRMLAISEKSGLLVPVKFQMMDESKELITVKVDAIC